MKRTKIYVLLTVLVTMLIILILGFMACRYTLNAENHVRYVGIMNAASEKIAKTISGMEMNAMNVFDEVQKNMDSPETVIAALQSKADLNPDANGYFAAFEPNYFPQKGRWFEPYVHKTDSGNKYVMSQVGSARHDYTKSDWYVHAEEVGFSFWSDPYYYYDGTSMSGHYCTFVEPIFDADKNLICVCGADMTLEWLTKELKRIDHASKQSNKTNSFLSVQEPDFYTVVMTNNGSCIASPEGKSVSMKYERALDDLKQRKSGMIETTVNGKEVTIYYGPIKNIDWTVAVVVPAKIFQKPVFTAGLLLLAVVVIGMIVVFCSKRFVMLTVAVMMLVMLALTFLICRSAMKAETQVRYAGILNLASNEITNSITSLEMNAMNVFDELQKRLNSPEAVIEALQSKTSLNPDIKGYFAAFEPDYFPQKGKWFQPYVHKAEGTNQYVVTQIGSETDDYTKSHLYKRAKEEGKSFWSEPYKYEDGTSMSGHYCSFMTPIYDAGGKLVCVCGADMTFEWLTNELKQINYASRQDDLLNKYLLHQEFDFYTVVMNDDGSCFDAPQGKSVTIMDANVLKDLKQRKGGTVEMMVNDKPATVYYGPVKDIDWTVAVIVPAQSIQQPVILAGVILLVVAVLGMIVIWLVLKSVRHEEL